MSERKIGFRQMWDGTWAAWFGFDLDACIEARGVGWPREDRWGVDRGAKWAVFVATTPWEASAEVCRALGEDLPVEWETLPWPVLREAHGVTQGVAHLLGASLEAKRAIAEAALSRRAYAVERASAAASQAARRLFYCGEVPSRHDVEQAMEAVRTAASGLPGYGPVARLLRVALDGGYPGRRRARRLLERAWSALVAVNIRNGIAQDSR